MLNIPLKELTIIINVKPPRELQATSIEIELLHHRRFRPPRHYTKSLMRLISVK